MLPCYDLDRFSFVDTDPAIELAATTITSRICLATCSSPINQMTNEIFYPISCTQSSTYQASSDHSVLCTLHLVRCVPTSSWFVRISYIFSTTPHTDIAFSVSSNRVRHRNVLHNGAIIRINRFELEEKPLSLLSSHVPT